MKTKITVVIFILCIGSVFGQSMKDIEVKYGKPTPAYSVSEHIWMTPEYTVDRQVCRMRLYPKRIAAETNYLSQKLPFKELQEVLNVLVPIDKRGAKKQGFGNTATGGPAAWTTFSYENVTFTFVSSFPSLGYDDSPPLKKGDYVFPIPNVGDDKNSESLLPSNDDFRYGETSHSDIVTVTWNGRKCIQQRD